MSIKFLCRLLALACALLIGTAPAAAEVTRSQISYVRDRFGNLVGARVAVVLVTANRSYTFDLGRQFLDLPLETQVALLNQRFGLGADADAIKSVLQGMQQSRQEEARRRQQEQIDRLTRPIQVPQPIQIPQPIHVPQPPIQIPQAPIFQPPITIPQGPGMQPIHIPQAPIFQPPIIIPR